MGSKTTTIILAPKNAGHTFSLSYCEKLEKSLLEKKNFYRKRKGKPVRDPTQRIGAFRH